MYYQSLRFLKALFGSWEENEMEGFGVRDVWKEKRKEGFGLHFQISQIKEGFSEPSPFPP